MLSFRSKILLFPYYLILNIRHFLYDHNIKKSYSFQIPIICIGNVTVGGTGKTPHCEMLLRLLKDKYKLALLSRGYKRKTKGFRYVSTTDSFRKAGDEPLQIKQKFQDVTVAVCEDRCYGIERLIKEQSPDAIILDDAFQHRKVRPSHSVVLVNYNNPVDEDELLPFGTLRDLPSRIHKADTIIVTGLPYRNDVDEDTDTGDISEYISKQNSIWRKKLNLSKSQNLFFSVIVYKNLKPIFADKVDPRYMYSKSALLFSGIANDSALRNHLSRHYKISEAIQFDDHRTFSKADIRMINKFAVNNPVSVIITTEKDSKRVMSANGISDEVKKRLFYIPIEVMIIPDKMQSEFLEKIMN